MRVYYEDLWERLPAELTAPEWELRRDLLCAELREGDRALDLGCGEGAFTAVMAEVPAVSVIGVEVAQNAINRARRAHPSIDFRRVELDAELPFADASFDLLWSSEVIEHVADTGLWLAEIRRVLAPGGRLLLTTPAHGRLRLLLGGIERYSPPLGDHLHLYTRRSLRIVLDELEFRHVRVWAASGPPTLRRTLFARAVTER